MPIVVPAKPPFAKKGIKALRAFDLGMNSKFSPLVIDDKEVSDIQNMNYDQKGALTKRKGYLKHYAATFDSQPARDLYNFRKSDGTSRLVLAANDKLYSDQPQFVRLYDVEADWESVGVQTSGVSTSAVPGDITLTPTGLGAMLLAAASALLGSPGGTRSGTWQSEPINISTVSDKTSGVMTIAQTSPASTTVLIQTRTSADGATGWSSYVGLGGGNTIISASNNYLQILVTLSTTVAASPSVQSLQVTFNTTATVTQIASSLSTLARYTFATQNDIVYIVNGSNTNREWNGTTLSTQGGSPPSAKYVFVHKNIMFLAGNSANPSRLYFSALSDPETWPVLNFIDVGKGDGDVITGLAILLDRLVIFKNNSVWILEGDASSNFILRRATDEAGCVDQHSIVVVHNTLGFMARDGFYFFDGVRVLLASEKINPTVAALNSAQFGLVSAIYFPMTRKVYVSLPSAGLAYNDTVLILDTLRSAWTVYKGIKAASWVIWRRFNTDYLLFGDTTTGQVYDAETGYSDDGSAISCYAVTKALDMGGTEIAKFVVDSFVTAKETSGTGNATVNVSFFTDLGTTETSTTPATVTGTSGNVKRTVPSAVGAGNARDIQIKVAESSSTRSITFYGIVLEYTPRVGVRAT